MNILTSFQGSAAIVTLNRPQRYNACDLETIQQITEFLKECASNPQVEKVIITSEHEKAFCVGGDIKAAYDAMQRKDSKLSSNFFKTEYKLVYDLANYPKPIISLVNGLCFGGGMGLSMHNRLRIVTENAALGMPETIIGFFPDVGSSYRFSYFPKAWANFYALTGYNIATSHALKWNMADYFVPANLLPELLNALCLSQATDQIIKQFSHKYPDQHVFGATWVEDIFTKSLEDIFEILKTHDHPEAQKTLSDLGIRSPLSLSITHMLIEMAQKLDLQQSLQLDQHLATNFLNNSDLQEGIRAQVIDKDRKPKWKYQFSNITDEMVKSYFRQPCNPV